MFGDVEDKLLEVAEDLLEVYDFEDILEINDLEIRYALMILIREGLIDTHALLSGR